MDSKELKQLTTILETALTNAILTAFDQINDDRFQGETQESILHRIETLEAKITSVNDRVSLKKALTGK